MEPSHKNKWQEDLGRRRSSSQLWPSTLVSTALDPTPLSSASTFPCTVDSEGLALFAQLSWILPSLGQSTHQRHVGIVVVVCLQLSECVALVLPERDVRAYRTVCVHCVVC